MCQPLSRSTARTSEAAAIRPWFIPFGILSLLALGSGCVSDSSLLQENATAALRSARFQARQDLSCPQVQVSLLSEQEVPGAPWGYLYSDYRIRADGCGVSAVYTVECRNESLCDVNRDAQ
jgi:hypothetical protein